MKSIKILGVLLVAMAMNAGIASAELKGKVKDGSCCDKAIKAGKECAHPCCVESAKEGKVCGKCNGAKKDKK